MKRLLDIIIALSALSVAGPIISVSLILIWLQDFRSPFYIAPRVGKDGKLFNMVKLRSMVINADKSGIVSTSTSDRRITPIGHFIRRYKLDELCQLWNVLTGEMSLVGPRPNVKRETDIYTSEEQGLLSVKPGITDFASIVFADEGNILNGKDNPDLAYSQLIRPWKSRLGLYYIQKQNLILDIKLIALTALAIVSRSRALRAVSALLESMGADPTLVTIARRETPLVPAAPPGAESIVTTLHAA